MISLANEWGVRIRLQSPGELDLNCLVAIKVLFLKAFQSGVVIAIISATYGAKTICLVFLVQVPTLCLR